MKFLEGKYEKRWQHRHCPDYYAWQDILHVMLVTLAVCLVVACAIFLLLDIMNPRQTSADDWVNLRVATRLSMSPSQGSLTDVSATVLRRTPLAKPTTHPAPVVESVTRSSKPVKILYMEVSAYSPSVAETDGNPHRTASGKHVYVGGIAADLRILPFGSIVIIPNYNGGKPCTVIDTGGAIRGLKLDMFLWSAHAAIHWGRRRNVRVQVLYIPRGR